MITICGSYPCQVEKLNLLNGCNLIWEPICHPLFRGIENESQELHKEIIFIEIAARYDRSSI